MTKTLSMVSHKNYNLNANEGFVISFTSKIITCFIDGFTSKRKSQPIVYLLNGSEHTYWILDLENEVHSHGLYRQTTFKNASVRPGPGGQGSSFSVLHLPVALTRANYLLLNGSEHIYWILDLWKEEHSIWVIWSSNLQEWLGLSRVGASQGRGLRL
jgi:hypothetical protein